MKKAIRFLAGLTAGITLILAAGCGGVSNAAKNSTADALKSALNSNNTSTVDFLCEQAGYNVSQEDQVYQCLSDFLGNIPTDCPTFPYCI